MKESKMRAMLREGCIGEFYTLNGYFVKIYPVFAIDKVKFSFVEKGKSGSGFDIYVDTMAFNLLCDDIRSGMMRRRIEADQGQYPGAWKYVTGENASKEVAIGKSKNGGVVIQGRDKTNKVNAFVPLTGYDDLRKMQDLYDLVSGKKGASDYYYKSLAELFWDTQADRDKWRKNDAPEEGEVVTSRYEAPAEQSAAQPAEEPAGWPFPDPQIPDGVKTMTATFLTEPAPAGERDGVLCATIETKGKKGSLWLSKRTAADRMAEIKKAVQEKHPIRIGYGIMENNKGEKQVWFVA